MEGAESQEGAPAHFQRRRERVTPARQHHIRGRRPAVSYNPSVLGARYLTLFMQLEAHLRESAHSAVFALRERTNHSAPRRLHGLHLWHHVQCAPILTLPFSIC